MKTLFKVAVSIAVGLVGVRALEGFIKYLNDPSMVMAGVTGIMCTLFAAAGFYHWLFKGEHETRNSK